MERLRLWINAGLAALLLVVGVTALSFLFYTRTKPAQHSLEVAAPSVRVAQVTQRTFSEPVVGYGTVRPRRQVHITPQVSGVLTQVHEGLAVGQRIKKGETLFQIDPATYQSQVAQLEANIRRVEANLAGLEEEKTGFADRLATASDQLGLAEKNYESEKELIKESATRGQDIDLALERLLQRKEVVLTYESQVAVIPFKIAEAQAQLDALKEQLAEAQRNVERTKIVAPFEARVESVSAQLTQAVTAYFSIATLTDLEVFEVPAVIDPQELLWANHLIRAKTMGRDLGTPPPVKVTWSGMGSKVSWDGQVTRLERHDEATRTDRVVVEVPNLEISDPDAVSNLERSIAQGMFVSVELPAEPLHEALVLPRHAIQENRFVYVFEPRGGQPDATEGTLGIRQVPMMRSSGDQVVVHFSANESDRAAAGEVFEGLETELAMCELRAGDEIILSNLTKPVVGMRLQKIRGDAVALLNRPELAPDDSPSTWVPSLAFAVTSSSVIELSR